MREGPLLERVAVESLTLETLLNAVERAARAIEGKRFAFKLQEKTRHVPTPDSEATHIDACNGLEPRALAYAAPSSEFAQVERHASTTREALERRERDDD
jgi:hypothetical protein